jgi:hypothetical protein
MKLWRGYGSEHSANLVMIGRFASPQDAELAANDFEKLRTAVNEEFDFDKYDEDDMSAFTEKLRQLLNDMKLYSFGPSDIAHFAYEHHFDRRGSTLEISTDELDVNGFLKFLIEHQASIEIYSAHDFPNGPNSPRAT